MECAVIYDWKERAFLCSEATTGALWEASVQFLVSVVRGGGWMNVTESNLRNVLSGLAAGDVFLL